MQVSVCRHLNMRLHIYCRQILFLTLNQRVGQLRHSLSVRAWRGRTHFARPMAYPCVALHFIIAFSCYDVRGWRIFLIRLCGMGLSAIPARILLFCVCWLLFVRAPPCFCRFVGQTERLAGQSIYMVFIILALYHGDSAVAASTVAPWVHVVYCEWESHGPQYAYSVFTYVQARSAVDLINLAHWHWYLVTPHGLAALLLFFIA